MERLRTLKSFHDSRVKLKNQKPIAVDVLFKAYPMVSLSCRSNLTDGTPLKNMKRLAINKFKLEIRFCDEQDFHKSDMFLVDFLNVEIFSYS